VSFQSVDNGIYNVAISPNDAKLYANHFADYLAEIAILNPGNGAVTKKIPAVLTVQVFSPDSRHLYCVLLGGAGVIDTATEVSTTAVASIPGASDLAITPDGKYLYITDVSTKSVLVADTATYTISAVLPLLIDGGGAIAIVAAH
jgi:YVTN family beta-propeller protein